MTFSDRLASETGLIALRSLARLLFAVLVFNYFLASTPEHANTLPGHAVFWGYLVAHGLLLARWIPGREALALVLDAVAITLAVALDPASPPPTLALFLISLLSAGMLRGLGHFFVMLLANGALIALLYALRNDGDNAFGLSTAFLLTVITACAGYLIVLLYRNKLMTRQAQAATWRDPQTGFISHQALIATAGWLLPLHDRLAASLTLALVRPANLAQMPELADQLATRLRKSDVAARYDKEVIALLLPCTAQTAAENLLTDMRQQSVPFYASMITLTNDQRGLEDTLQQLHQQLGRAIGNPEHWLVHAIQPAGNH